MSRSRLRILIVSLAVLGVLGLGLLVLHTPTGDARGTSPGSGQSAAIVIGVLVAIMAALSARRRRNRRNGNRDG